MASIKEVPGDIGQVSQMRSTECYAWVMSRTVSIRELRNSTSRVIDDVENGVPLTLTVNKRPVADIVPHQLTRSPWVSSDELRRIVSEFPVDPGLLDDIATVREGLIEDE
jgi:prevent-host-death family protein